MKKANLILLPALLASFPVLSKTKEEKTPNILFIIADDLGKGDLSCYGNNIINTPNIDRIGQKGTVLDRYRSAAPISGPSRVSILTGRYHERSGYRMTHIEKTSSLSEPWLAGELRELGYNTIALGKWHLGDTDFKGRGFDSWVITAPGGWSDFYEYKIISDDAPVRDSDGTYATDFLTDKAIEYIGRRVHDENPFFMYLAYNAPHFPLQAPEEEIEPFRGKGLEKGTEIVYGMISRLDKNIGRLMAALERYGISDNTLIVFTSDNGPYFGKYKGLSQLRWNCNLAGSKECVLEGGINVPCLIQWGNRIVGRKDIPFNAIDWAPTIIDIAGGDNKGKAFDGTSRKNALVNNTPVRKHTGFWCYNKAYLTDLSNCAVIEGKWKLYRPIIRELNAWNNKGNVPEIKEGEKWELYDLDKDPCETKDISSGHPRKVLKMAKKFNRWWSEVLNENERISGKQKYTCSSAQVKQDWAGLGKYAEMNRTAPKHADAIFMGNSITEGWAKKSPGFFTENGYLCRGASGQVTSQMLLIFRQDVINLSPKCVVILAGTNDIAQNKGYISLENIFGNIVSMCELAKSNDIEVIICSILPVLDYPWRKGLEPAE